MGNLTQQDMNIVYFLIGVIAVLLVIVMILDLCSKKKKKNNLEELELENDEETTISKDNAITEEVINCTTVNEIEETKPFLDKPNHVQEIKYVEEDEELEKTKARIELAELKEELKRQELEKQEKIIEEKQYITTEPALEDNNIEEVPVELKNEPITSDIEEEIKKQVIEEIEQLEIVDLNRQDVSDIADAINEKLEAIEENNIQKMNDVQEDLNEILEISKENIIIEHEDEQERKAIISVEEFNKISDEMYDSNEIMQMAYEDEGNEPISLIELENLYNTRELKTIELDDFNTIKEEEKQAIIDEADIKKMEDLPPIAVEKKFKSTPFISPVFGISETKETIELEQTANLDKLNEEIKKTNEFLKTLKELQKNLD